MPAKTRDFVKALNNKGFVEDRNGNHIFYYYRNSDGKINNKIQTKISHGDKGVLSDSLLSVIKREMKFEKTSELMEYIECTYTLEKYRKMLIDKGYDKSTNQISESEKNKAIKKHSK